MPIDTQQEDITLASTTESQAELDHATGPNWRQPFSPPDPAKQDEAKPGEASNAKDDATKTRAASEAAKPGAKEGAENSKKDDDEDDAPLPKGVQKRLDRLTARLKEAEERLAERDRSTAKPAAAAKPANTDPEPQLKDFKSWEEWNQAHTRWSVRDESRKLAAKDAETRAQESAKETYDSHLARIEEARAAHDDFDDVVSGVSLSFASDQSNRAFQLAVIEADNGPEILYHLAQNPEEMAKFAELSPVKVQMMVGRISAKLSGETPSGQDVTPKPAPKPPQSKTPAPTTQVRRSTTATGTNIYDPETSKKMSDDDWLRRREEDVRSRNRRRQ